MLTPEEFIAAARKAGFVISESRRRITLSSTFEPRNEKAMRSLYRAANDLLANVPIGGTPHIEGTEPGSVTGYGALCNGYFHLTMWGVSRPFVRTMNEALNETDPRTMAAGPTENVGKWLVQLSKGNASYRTVQSTRSERQALFLLSCYNVHSGYNKRVMDPAGKVVARVRTAV